MHKATRIYLVAELRRGDIRYYWSPLCGARPSGTLWHNRWKSVTCKKCLRKRTNTSKGAVEAIPQPK